MLHYCHQFGPQNITAFLPKLRFPHTHYNAKLAVSHLHTPEARLEKLHFRGRKQLFQSGWSQEDERKVRLQICLLIRRGLNVEYSVFH